MSKIAVILSVCGGVRREEREREEGTERRIELYLLLMFCVFLKDRKRERGRGIDLIKNHNTLKNHLTAAQKKRKSY